MEKIKNEIVLAKNKIEAVKYSMKNFGQGSQKEIDFLEREIMRLKRLLTIKNISNHIS